MRESQRIHPVTKRPYLTEGTSSKGGVNPPPVNPEPPKLVPGQGGELRKGFAGSMTFVKPGEGYPSAPADTVCTGTITNEPSAKPPFRGRVKTY
jgi:hypothetical protein